VRQDRNRPLLAGGDPLELRIWAGEGQLPELIKRVRALEKRVRELEARRS